MRKKTSVDNNIYDIIKVMKIKNKLLKQAGFTMVELLSVMAVVTIITTIVLVNYRGNSKNNILKLTAQEIANSLRRAQNMALSGQRFNNGTPRGGFGVHFDLSSPQSYIIFADTDNNQAYNIGEEFDNILLHNQIEIYSLDLSIIDIVFAPPAANVNITGGAVQADIGIRIKGTSINKNINITSAGVISY